MQFTVLEIALLLCLFVVIIYNVFIINKLRYTEKLKNLTKEDKVKQQERAYEMAVKATVAGIKRFEAINSSINDAKKTIKNSKPTY